MLRLASQVSWAASLSRLRGVAEIVMAKPFCSMARDLAFEAAEMVDIGDDAFADVAAHRRDQRHAAGRHVDDLAGIFAAVRQHVAAEQVDAHALVAPAFLRHAAAMCDFGCGSAMRRRTLADEVRAADYSRFVNGPLAGAISDNAG